MAFQKGNKLAAGGKRDDSGRKPDKFKQKCQELANSPAMLQWLHDIVDGRIVVDPEVRLKAWDRLADRGYGRPAQGILAVDGDGKAIPYSISVTIDG